MADKARQRKMVNIDISETSGVDHPAHLTEGWMILKSADAATVNKLFGSPDATKEGATMPANDEVKTEAVTPEVEETEKLEAEKAASPGEATKDEVINALKAEIKELKSKSVEKSAEEPEDLTKSADLPEAVKVFMQKQKEDLEKAQADFAKERDIRLDTDAITKSRETFKALGLNHEEVAPALRRVAALDADLAKSVDTVLKAADAQLTEAGLFSEVGKSTTSGAGDTAYAQIRKAAQKMVDDGIEKNLSTAIAKASEAHPDLYTQYLNESVGK